MGIINNIEVTLEYPRRILIIGILCTAFFLSITIISNVFPNETVTWKTTTTFIILSLLGVYIIIDCIASKYNVTSNNIRYRNLFFRTYQISWEEIDKVDYSRISNWFILKTRNNKRIRVSLLLKGIGEFKILLSERINETKISKVAKEELIYIFKKA
ncbi:MAG: hypothetical protein KF721_09790 [Ignavibacteriaceae bacterium]|nr:hypothetical protein [Ignavibacteriaceae bacterium]